MIFVFSTGDTDEGFIDSDDLMSVLVEKERLFVTDYPFITIERLKVPDS